MIPAEQDDPVLRVTIQDNLQSGESGKKSEDPIKVQLLANATGKSGPRLFGLYPNGLFTFVLSLFGLQRHLDYKDIWTITIGLLVHLVNIRIARPRNALWRAILMRAILHPK